MSTKISGNSSSPLTKLVTGATTAAKTTAAATTSALNAATTLGNAATASKMAALNNISSFTRSTATAMGAAAGKWHAGAVNTATTNAQALGSGGALSKVGAGAGLAGGLYGIGSYGSGLVSAIKNKEGGHAIADNALRLAKAGVTTVKSGLDTAAAFQGAKNFNMLQNSAKAALAGKAPAELVEGLSKAAATAVHNGKPLTQLDVMASLASSKGTWAGIKTGVKGAASSALGGLGFTGVASKIDGNIMKAGQAVVDAATVGKTVSAGKASTTAVKLATSVGDDIAKGAAKGAGAAAKTAGRFTPGLNVAIAALDVGIAARTLADPNASVAAKVTTSITAAGSVLAATNIPIVSQVGAAVSLVSTGVGIVIENAGVIGDGLKAAGSAIADGAKAVGSAIGSAAKKVFSGW